MILITKEGEYINLDNVQMWWITKTTGKTCLMIISFGKTHRKIIQYLNEESAKKAFKSIRQGLLKNLLFVKL